MKKIILLLYIFPLLLCGQSLSKEVWCDLLTGNIKAYEKYQIAQLNLYAADQLLKQIIVNPTNRYLLLITSKDTIYQYYNNEGRSSRVVFPSHNREYHLNYDKDGNILEYSLLIKRENHTEKRCLTEDSFEIYSDELRQWIRQYVNDSIRYQVMQAKGMYDSISQYSNGNFYHLQRVEKGDSIQLTIANKKNFNTEITEKHFYQNHLRYVLNSLNTKVIKRTYYQDSEAIDSIIDYHYLPMKKYGREGLWKITTHNGKKILKEKTFKRFYRVRNDSLIYRKPLFNRRKENVSYKCCIGYTYIRGYLQDISSSSILLPYSTYERLNLHIRRNFLESVGEDLPQLYMGSESFFPSKHSIQFNKRKFYYGKYNEEKHLKELLPYPIVKVCTQKGEEYTCSNPWKIIGEAILPIEVFMYDNRFLEDIDLHFKAHFYNVNQ